MSCSQPSESELEKLKEKLQVEGIVQCPVNGCAETFKSIWGLRFHLKKNNCNAPKFKCEKCNGTFRSRIILQQHLTSCTGEDSFKEKVISNETHEKDVTVGPERPTIKEDKILHDNEISKVTESSQKDQNNVSFAKPITKTSSNGSNSSKTQEKSLETSNNTPRGLSKSLETDSTTVFIPGSIKATALDSSKISSKEEITEISPTKTSEHLSSSTKEQSTAKQGDETPKRKRGRPKKAISQDGSQGGVVTPKAKPAKKKTKLETPKNIESTPSRKSSRSTGKKVNYAQLDQSDDDDEDEEDDDEDEDDGDIEPSKPKRGRPRKTHVTDNDETQSNTDNKTDEIVGTNVIENIDNSTSEKDIIETPAKTPTIKETPTKTPTIKETPTKTLTIKEKPSKTPTKRKEKKKVLSEEEVLKRKTKRGQIIKCANDCGKRFTTFLGYKSHMKLCGQKERKTFNCEICGKEYQSEPGLKYHMKAAHEKKPIQETVIEEDNSNDISNIDSGIDAPRRMRQAAARAMKKVHDLKNDKIIVEKAVIASHKKSEILDSYIIKLRDGMVTNAMVAKWKQDIKTNGKLVCPNEHCDEEFTSSFVLQTHFLQCGFDNAPYKCNECEKEFSTINGARYHIENFHQQQDVVDDDSDNDELYFDEYEEDSEDDGDGDDISISDMENELEESKDTRRKERRTYQDRKMSLAVGPMNNTYRIHEKWRKKNIPKEGIFTELIPRIHCWQRVKIDNISEYIPISTSSPRFIIQRPNNKTNADMDDSQLPLFTSLDKNDSGNYGDRIFYTGGPVWGLGWCPTLDSSKTSDQYIIVSVHRSYQTTHHAYKCHKEKGILQLWNIGPLANNSSRSGESPKLALCIAHNFGPIFKMAWCPYGVWHTPDTQTDDNSIPRLGLLALACGDGLVRILSIPHPDKLLSKLPAYSSKTDQDKEFNKVMVHGTSQMDLFPCPLNIDYDGQRGMAMCVDWSQVKPFHCIAAGFSDGSVALWNLSTQSTILRKTQDIHHHTIRLAPYILMNAHSSLVRGVALCPSNQDIMVTGSEERCYKIWDLKSTSVPMVVLKKGYPYELEWPLHTRGFLYCEQELYSKEQPSVRYCNITTVDHVRAMCIHASGIWSLSFNQWLKIAASADIAGDVYISKIPPKSSTTKWPLYKTHLEDRNSNTENNGNDNNQDEKHEKLKQRSPSLEETIGSSRLVFEDRNLLQFQNMIPSNYKDLSENPSTFSCNTSTLQSVHKVRWNPNKQAMTWIASGGASGLVRLHHVKEAKSREPIPVD